MLHGLGLFAAGSGRSGRGAGGGVASVTSGGGARRRGRADPSDSQRDRPPPRRSDCPTGPRRRAPPPLVTLATPPPAPRPDLPLPAANNPRPCNITIYGWSTSSPTWNTPPVVQSQVKKHRRPLR